MNEVIKSPTIVLKRLVLCGRNKDYFVDFEKGINIIYGDMDTGKSSILNLIDYMLGHSVVYMYDELEKEGKYCLLELYINNNLFTIKRDIFNENQYIEVYYSSIEKLKSEIPQLYGPHFNKRGPSGFFSDFLLEAMSIPAIKIKQSPSKADSKMSRLSFRDIFRFCYLNQDDVGSKSILGNTNYALFAKNKEVFKYLFNVLDTQVSEIEEEISAKRKENTKLKNNFETVYSFLAETNFNTLEAIHDKKANLSNELISIQKKISEINTNMQGDDEVLEELRVTVINLEQRLKSITDEKMSLRHVIDQHLSLKKEYQKELDKLELVNESIKAIPNHPNREFLCPVCNSNVVANELEDDLHKYSFQSVKNEIKGVKRRFKELKMLIQEEIEDLSKIENQEEEIKKSLYTARELLDKKAKDYIAPYIIQRDILVSEEAKIKEKHIQLEHQLNMRKKLENIRMKSEDLTNHINELEQKLAKLKETTPSLEKVLTDIGSNLELFLRYIPIKNAYNISISKKNFLPVVRGREYTKLTSGGLRTVTSIGYFVSLHEFSLKSNTNLPSFLMIDTIGKYLGKRSDDNIIKDDEEMSDPQKYNNLYRYLIKLVNKHSESQIIIVDNDLPDLPGVSIKNYVIKEFKINEEGKPTGFIS